MRRAGAVLPLPVARSRLRRPCASSWWVGPLRPCSCVVPGPPAAATPAGLGNGLCGLLEGRLLCMCVLGRCLLFCCLAAMCRSVPGCYLPTCPPACLPARRLPAVLASGVARVCSRVGGAPLALCPRQRGRMLAGRLQLLRGQQSRRARHCTAPHALAPVPATFFPYGTSLLEHHSHRTTKTAEASVRPACAQVASILNAAHAPPRPLLMATPRASTRLAAPRGACSLRVAGAAESPRRRRAAARWGAGLLAVEPGRQRGQCRGAPLEQDLLIMASRH